MDYDTRLIEQARKSIFDQTKYLSRQFAATQTTARVEEMVNALRHQRSWMYGQGDYARIYFAADLDARIAGYEELLEARLQAELQARRGKLPGGPPIG
jgi:hypothetical protein